MEDRCLARRLQSMWIIGLCISWKIPRTSHENPLKIHEIFHENPMKITFKKKQEMFYISFHLKKSMKFLLEKERIKSMYPNLLPPFRCPQVPPGPHRRSSTMNQKAQDPDLRRCDMGIYHGVISLQRLHRIGPSWVWVEIRPFFFDSHSHCRLLLDECECCT